MKAHEEIRASALRMLKAAILKFETAVDEKRPQFRCSKHPEEVNSVGIQLLNLKTGLILQKNKELRFARPSGANERGRLKAGCGDNDSWGTFIGSR